MRTKDSLTFAAWVGALLLSMANVAYAAEGPYGGTPAPIPGTVKAENYDTGGQGVAYNVTSVNGTDNSYRSDGVDLETTSAPGAGNDLGWTATGQWFKYTVNVATAGTYTVTFEVAAPGAVSDGFHLSNASGTNLSGSVNVPATGGWQAWATVTATVTLAAGQQTLTVNQDNGGWNIYSAAFVSTAGTGGTDVLDISAGGTGSGSYVADEDFSGGTAAATTATINTSGVVNPAPQAVYQSQRYGNFTYTLPGFTAGTTYVVRLHFDEFYWTAAGKREFNVLINGTQVLTDFDIFATTGGEDIAIAEQFNAVANSSGQIVIQFVSVVDNAEVDGIEVETSGNTSGEGPYGGIPAAIPGTVQAENYDTGGQGVDYDVSSTNGSANSYRSDGVDLEATTDAGGGYDLGWTAAGQWFKYTVNVATAGTYTVTFRVAAESAISDAFHISNSSGTDLSGTVSVPDTGGWQTWTNVTATVTLPAGQQTLTFNQDTAGWNLNWFSFASGSGGGTGDCAAVSNITVGSTTYTPSWCQEFNGSAGSPSTTAWNFDLGNNGGWGNGEQEVYCGPPGYSGNPSQCPTSFSTSTAPVYIDGNGHLVIQPIFENGAWLSGRMNTEGLQNFQYGILEASIQLPNTTNQGLWPAFWTLGSDITTVPWPTCGEADIMENWSPQVDGGAGPAGNNSTIHTALTGGDGVGGRYTFPGGEAGDTAFHTYGVIWTPNQMQFFVDNATTPFFTVTPSDLPSGDTWPFNANLFVLLNVAVGGTLGGSTSGLSNPQPMVVDYVRYYTAQ